MIRSIRTALLPHLGLSKALSIAPARHGLKSTKPRPLSDPSRPNHAQQTRQIMSLPQIMFDPEQPHVSIPSPQGLLHRNIRASFPKKAHKVVAELNDLFASASTSASAAASPSPPLQGTPWHLDPSCDAISRVFVFPPAMAREAVAGMAAGILRVAEELKHHPAVSVAGAAAGSPWVVIVTCGTHQPAGLSVKDVRLARGVDGVVGGFVDVEADGEKGEDDGEAVRGVDVDVEADGEKGEDDGEAVRGVDVDVDVDERLREWHWRENIGRAVVRLDVVEEEEDLEGGSNGAQKGGLRFWQLNTVDDVQTFMKDQKVDVSNDGPNLRGLML